MQMTTNVDSSATTVLKTTLGFLCALLLAGGIARAQQKPTSLTGAWQVTKVQITGPNVRTVTNPQPGLYLFTAKYFSIMMVTGELPRPIHPTLPEVPKATPQEILAVYGPYVANTGTYEVNGGTLITHPMVSKNPELTGECQLLLQNPTKYLDAENSENDHGSERASAGGASGDLDTYASGIRMTG